MDQPLISIIIPVYNGSDYLEEAINSALAQTYENKEIIVINDGSTDGGRTEELALSFGSSIRYYSKQNGGVASALNYGIREAKGEYVSWLSHDDVYEESKLEAQVKFLHEHGLAKNVILYCSMSYIDENSRHIGDYPLMDTTPQKFYEMLISGMRVHSVFRHERAGLNGCTALIPKQAFDMVGYFDETLKTTQDYDYWFKANAKYDFILMRERLLRSRIHQGMGTIRLKGVSVQEIDRLYGNAFDLYQPGSGKFDLDLPKVVLALKLDPRKNSAYRKAYRMARNRNNGWNGMQYLIAAKLWNRGLAYVLKVGRFVKRKILRRPWSP